MQSSRRRFTFEVIDLFYSFQLTWAAKKQTRLNHMMMNVHFNRAGLCETEAEATSYTVM